MEIGTGTGYSTALLAQRVGAATVTSIEIDQGLAHHAAAVLHAAGITPQLVVGDVEAGYPPGAPYDRIVATASFRALPQALIDQLWPEGVLLAPLDSPFQCDGLVRLVADGGGRASGRFVGAVDFMPVRGQRVHRSYAEVGWPVWADYHITVDQGWQRVRTDGSGT
nr:methyltransferase domain-containing protein [Streptomyces typhae]